MQINVHGLEEDIATRAIRFFCRELDIEPQEISVMADSTISANGMCFENVSGDYLILVNTASRNITEIFLTIAHEMVHVKQYMKDNLAQCHAEDGGKTSYRQRWWEKEAFEMETQLVIALVNAVKQDWI